MRDVNYQKYYETAHEGNRLFEAGDSEGAMAKFLSLIESDLPDLDKAMMCGNLGSILAKAGKHEEALEWYEQGVALEEAHMRYVVAEQRAGYLAQRGRDAEALGAYEKILESSSLMLGERERIGGSVEMLRERKGGR